MKTINRKTQPLFKVALFWGAFWLVLFIFRALSVPFLKEWMSLLVASVIAGLSFILAALLVKKERKSLADIGLGWNAKSVAKFMIGTLCGMLVMAIMLFIILGFSAISIELAPAPDYWNAIGYSALVLFALAAMEEIAFRTYPLFRLSEVFGVRTAIYITSLFFALYHGLSPMNLLGPGVWGLFFAISAIAFKGIAVPLGLHFGLNWLQSFVGMKLQYASSIWSIAPGEDNGLLSTETLGLGLQLFLLVLGVVVIEIYLRKTSKTGQSSL
ncbi:lysostaphin resistance A-like protein [Neptunicella sp.]|uniref:CPBP family intramembrane glutamic endopeptidase n=1 Tax=Neptunicella sp. TaxID=2125986 RepID=UPI003F693FBE